MRNVFTVFRTSDARPTIFPTTKINFLTTKIVLCVMHTITVSRNVTDDFRTENEHYLVYGSRHMQFSVFGGGGGSPRATRPNLKPVYLKNG